MASQWSSHVAATATLLQDLMRCVEQEHMTLMHEQPCDAVMHACSQPCVTCHAGQPAAASLAGLQAITACALLPPALPLCVLLPHCYVGAC
jgi:hypothetical protein